MFHSERLKRITVVFVVIVFLSTQGLAQEVATTNVLTKCDHIFSTIYPIKEDLLAGIRFTTVPPDAASQSEKLVPGTIMVMNHLPHTDKEYVAIFGKKVITPAMRSEINSVKRSGHNSTPLEKDTRKSFADMIGIHLKQPKENIIVLIGHNERGDFIFRDGSREGISSIVEACAIAAKICVFLSCLF